MWLEYNYVAGSSAGCLMILAWVFFSSIGMLMTKYYKTMWPNKRMFDQRYWFVVGTPSQAWSLPCVSAPPP